MRERVKTGIDPGREQRKRRSITLHTVSLIFKFLDLYYEFDVIMACPFTVFAMLPCNKHLKM